MKKSIFIIILIVIVGSIFYYIYPKSELETKEVTANILNTENSMAIYLKGEDNRYHQISAIPDGNYILNETETYCTEPDNINTQLKNRVAYDSSTKTLSVSTLTKKNTKCYLYFDEYNPAKDTLTQLKQYSQGPVNSFTGTSCNSGCDLQQNGIYEAEDDYGTSYYYRGTVDNNWVVFGKENNNYIWWRIIRINGNGSIRIMYAGTNNSTTEAPETTGYTTMIKPKTSTSDTSNPRGVYFNQTDNDNKYVGYMYPGQKGSASATFDGAHAVKSGDTKSDALTQIALWYGQDTNLSSLADRYIDVDTGFCSDNSLAQGKHGSYTGDGIGTHQSGYAGLDRVWQQGNESVLNPQMPTFKCGYAVSTQITDQAAQKRDLYTGPNATPGGIKGSNGEFVEGNNALPVPVGLITSDEVIYAGGFFGQANATYWLKTNQLYWTISPSYYYPIASIFRINREGQLGINQTSNSPLGTRPVINLKSNTTFTFNDDEPAGTSTNPYIVNID